jgi:hypothetical protein
MTNKPAAAPAFMDKAGIEKAIKSIAVSGAKLDKAIQSAALSAINHRVKTNDAVFYGKLYAAMPAGSRRSALALWFLQFGAVVLNTDAATKGDRPFVNAAKSVQADLEGAAAMQWHEAKKEPELSEMFDITKALQAVLAKATKAKSVNNPELLRLLNAAVSDAPTPAGAAKADAAPAQAALI